ncbi:RNA methyltransferase [Streptomyces sp. TRM 70361]|uniref:TrmH family RNA methyltransferase n=1 Tax=Streptomyces sp. TRM 70361 TaxID=3116553 RepID=UPI002E7BFDC0|nr:RNA methyltransferase [Streptomyces sp. TRM 70361]MEE1939089.1 RNA methyltransferase [Streptomyces sp. TRM 70361]
MTEEKSAAGKSGPVTIGDPGDPRLADYTDLTDVQLRRRREPAEGLFIAEGEKVIRRALAAGYRMRSMLLTPRWAEAMRDVTERVPAPVYTVSPELAEKVTGYHVHRGALASMHRRPLPSPAGLLADGCGTVAVLEGLVDHTNVGAVYRSAAALGVGAVLLSPDCADPLYRRSVKVSMGAVFSVPHARVEDWPGGLRTVREAGYRLLALTPDPGAVPLGEVPRETLRRCAVMLGSEGQGLSAGALRAADLRVRIPMAHGIDSLNIAAAAAVGFYALAEARKDTMC